MALTSDGFDDLIELRELFCRTRDWLHLYMESHGDLDADGTDFLASTTLTHIEDVQEGFRWSVRASQAGRDELRYLIRSADLIDCSDSPDSRRDRRLIEPELRRLAALANARLVFSMLPKLPEQHVTYPGVAARSYADIPVPRGPADLADRIEELERGIWQTAVHKPVDRLDLIAYRRVYGFFEAGSWVVTQHLNFFRRA